MYRKLLSHLQPKRRPSLVAVEGLAPTESAFTPSVDDKVNAISRTFLGLSHTLKIYVKYSLYEIRFLLVDLMHSQLL